MDGRTTFPRVSGGIVLDGFSIVSLFTGLLAALPAGLFYLVDSTGPRSAGFGAVVTVVWGLTVLVFVSRFAQLGIVGETEGGLFSSAAGSWGGTFLAAARLLVLWVVWLLPVIAWAALRDDAAATGFASAGFAPVPFPRAPFLLTLWSGLAVVLSFAFVAVAVAAPGFGALFSPALWRTLFAGRIGELFLAMAGAFGPPVAVFVVAMPLLTGFVPGNPKLALTAFVPVLLYVAGMVLSLQGKLCGAYAAGSLAEEAELPEEAAVAAPAGAQPEAAPAPAAPPLGDPATLHATWRTRLAAGDVEGAVAAARELIPAGLAKGETKAATEAYRRHLDRLPDLRLDRTALDLLADQLLRDGDVAAAAWTFSQALDADPADPKAFKGLLRVAEHHLEKGKQPIEAVRVYRYLLERAPASPFADHARDLLADAERKATRPAAQQG